MSVASFSSWRSIGKLEPLMQDLGPGSTDQLLHEQVLRKEYLVLCKQDSRTICTVSDRAELDGPAGGKFTCTVCGRAFKDETVQDIFALTEFVYQRVVNAVDDLLQGRRPQGRLTMNATRT